jgi:Zn-dependent M32 family carboxypeptidase
MNGYTFRPEEEAEFDMVMAQAREDAWTFGISQRFEAYLEQFAPGERMQHVLAMFAALENQLELCQRLLCIAHAQRNDTIAMKKPTRRAILSLRSQRSN